MERLIQDLKSVEYKYKDKHYHTGETCVGDMAHACRQAIEELQAENERLREQVAAWAKADKEGRLVESPRKVGDIDLLKCLLCQLDKEEKIISKESGRDYAHLSFQDGRSHTLMRVKAWANTQLKILTESAAKGESE